jgi:hypothetical protein
MDRKINVGRCVSCVFYLARNEVREWSRSATVAYLSFFYASICPEKPRKITMHCWDILCSGWHSNRVSMKYKLEALSAWIAFFVLLYSWKTIISRISPKFYTAFLFVCTLRILFDIIVLSHNDLELTHYCVMLLYYFLVFSSVLTSCKVLFFFSQNRQLSHSLDKIH